jgi:cytochrome c oxidase assembly protein subunit 11
MTSGRPAKARMRLTAFVMLSVFAGMVGLTYASVPLYRMFCSATGFGGTTQRAEVAPAHPGARSLTVRFDGNVGPGLPWTFEPEQPQITLRTGQTATVYYKVRNDSGRSTTARAEYNVTPDVMGGYFDKISCFCFSEQTVGPGETVEMPVVFFLDPGLEKDKSMAAVDSVTLSYTFFPVRDRSRAIATGNEVERPADKKL